MALAYSGTEITSCSTQKCQQKSDNHLKNQHPGQVGSVPGLCSFCLKFGSLGFSAVHIRNSKN